MKHLVIIGGGGMGKDIYHNNSTKAWLKSVDVERI